MLVRGRRDGGGQGLIAAHIEGNAALVQRYAGNRDHIGAVINRDGFLRPVSGLVGRDDLICAVGIRKECNPNCVVAAYCLGRSVYRDGSKVIIGDLHIFRGIIHFTILNAIDRRRRGVNYNAVCTEIGDIAHCVCELRINGVSTVRVQLERFGVRGKVSFCAFDLRESLVGNQIANLHRIAAGFRSRDGHGLRRVVKPCEIDAFEALPCGVLIDADLALRIPGRRPLRGQSDALYVFISRKLRIGGSGKHGFAGTVPAAEIIVGSGGRLHAVQHALLPPDAGFFADTCASGGIILYGIRGLRVSADGEIVLGLAAVVPRAVQRHLGGFFRVKARVVRVDGVRIYIVGIGGGVVRILRKLLRFVLARLMGKPRQLLFAAVIGAVRQPLHRQKPLLIAISNIILAAERAFAVFVEAMVNARSVDGAAADGDVFRRNTRQLLCVQVVIDIIGIVHVPTFRMPEGFHCAVHDLNIGIQGRLVADSDAGNIFGIIHKQPAAFCGHGAVFNKDP